jgi:hypothetical protein
VEGGAFRITGESGPQNGKFTVYVTYKKIITQSKNQLRTAKIRYSRVYKIITTIIIIKHCKNFEGKYWAIIFMVTPCINDIKHFNVQLMHTTLKT